jgi:DNA-binding NarL/FixJ family response regulator
VQRNREGGFTTIQYVVATAFSLLLFVMVANLLVDLYERGAVRDALDEGVRAAVPASSSTEECLTRARAVIASIASGTSLRVDSMTCVREGDRIVANARISLRSWFPMLLPDWQLDLRASAHQEG